MVNKSIRATGCLFTARQLLLLKRAAMLFRSVSLVGKISLQATLHATACGEMDCTIGAKLVTSGNVKSGGRESVMSPIQCRLA